MTSLGSEALPARLFKAIPRLRDALVAAAEEGRVMLPAEASEATDGAVPARGLGKALEVIAADCVRRGEPDLGVLVVKESALVEGTDSGGYVRQRVWQHFGGQGAVEAGAASEALVVERATRAPGASRSATTARAPRSSAPRAERAAAPRRTAAAKAAPTPVTPPSICPDCFTVRSASGSCLC